LIAWHKSGSVPVGALSSRLAWHPVGEDASLGPGGFSCFLAGTYPHYQPPPRAPGTSVRAGGPQWKTMPLITCFSGLHLAPLVAQPPPCWGHSFRVFLTILSTVEAFCLPKLRNYDPIFGPVSYGRGQGGGVVPGAMMGVCVTFAYLIPRFCDSPCRILSS